MNAENKNSINDYDVIVLAAGESNRFSKGNKLLFKINHYSILINVIKEICLTNMNNILVVTGFEYKIIQNSLRKYAVKVIQNKHYSKGISSSISLGIKNLSRNSQAVMICLADMPLIKSANYNQLLSFHHKYGGREWITAPRKNQVIGNPIIWGAVYYEELLKLKGDLGGKQILKKFKQNLKFCDVESQSFFIDIDTEKDLYHCNKSTIL